MCLFDSNQAIVFASTGGESSTVKNAEAMGICFKLLIPTLGFVIMVNEMHAATSASRRGSAFAVCLQFRIEHKIIKQTWNQLPSN